MKDVILYHGSRGGIDGEIQPISRVRCDFGKGFYMGESEEQAKGLIVEECMPILYMVKFKLSEIPPHRILNLTDTDWLYAVLANRKSVKQFNELELAKRWIEKIKSYDVVIGPIADDRMNEAMQRFAEYTLTDEGLRKCLEYVNYGKQYVAKTQSACEKIEILSKRALSYDELESVRDYSREKRKEGHGIITKMTIECRNKGSYLNEIIDFQKNRVKGRPIR